MVSKEKINEIRNKVDIVEIISDYIPLTKKGRNYFCVCPFHDDHSPSMSISSDKQIYTCFSCGASGNVFNFLMEYENISFNQALKILADKCGVVIDGLNIKKEISVNNIYYDIYNKINKLYINNINTASGSSAYNYLLERKLDDNLIKEFEIGLSLSGNEVSKILKVKKIDDNTILKTGLVRYNESMMHDYFYNRIMFPIWDSNGFVVGYSGRLYKKSDAPKYINTIETEYFKKGDILYNFHRAKKYVRLKKFLLIMEGFMDVIRAFSAGYENSIATMGTAFTKNHINKIKKISNIIYLCFDGDNAGKKATFSAGNLLVENNILVKVVDLGKYDPDEFILKFGNDEFSKRITEAISFSEFKIKYYKENVDFNDSNEVSSYINRVLNEINVEDDILREVIINRLSNEVGISVEFLKSKLKVKEKNLKEKIVIKKNKYKKRNKYLKAERLFIHYMLHNPELIITYKKRNLFMPSSECRFLVSEIMEFYDTYKRINVADLITFLGDKKEMLSLICEVENITDRNHYSDSEIEDYVFVLREYNKNKLIENYKSKIKEENDINKKAVYADEIRKLNIGEFDISENN